MGWSGEPAWPSITASPGAPGTDPPLYQPASHPLEGRFMNPYRFTPTASTGRWTFRIGISNCTGGAVGMSALALTDAPLADAQPARLLRPGSASPSKGCSTEDA